MKMKTPTILFSVFSITLLSFGGWFAVLQSIDPYRSRPTTVASFYIFLGLVLWGMGAIAIYWHRQRTQKASSANLTYSIRQALIVSLGIVGLLAFQTIGVLNILSATVYIIALILIEVYFRMRKINYG